MPRIVVLALIVVFSNTAFSQSIASFNFLSKVEEAKEFVEANNYNTDFCLLINMGIHSGKYRMFVYDFKADSIIGKGLCSHGACHNTWGGESTKTSPQFSNITDSHCSSLGKFRIGARGYSGWGIHVHYLLHGLESTNDNALNRVVVLHSWDNVRDYEIYPVGTAEGLGCPAVSDNYLTFIDGKLKKSKKPVLFWIYK